MPVGPGRIPHKTVEYFIFSTAAPVVSPDYRAVLHLSFISPLNRPRVDLAIPASGTSLCFPQVTFPFRQNREDDLSTAVLAPSRPTGRRLIPYSFLQREVTGINVSKHQSIMQQLL
ncbi:MULTISPECIES: hypothetical protein [Herbaspirillum]|uniref:hypothetical protein n=1 Tax=Herbaspirillum TaxID=963 RepID=UPI0012F69377|nr:MULTISPECIES: hypothetical protein [Herbaspirillum]